MSFLQEQIALRKNQLHGEMKALQEELEELRIAELAISSNGMRSHVKAAGQPPVGDQNQPEASLIFHQDTPSIVQSDQGGLFRALTARPQRRSHWQMVRAVLESEPTLDHQGIAQRVLEQFGIVIPRETLSVELSKWRYAGKLKRDGRLWSILQQDNDSQGLQ